MHERVAEGIELADCDVLDLMRSRAREQSVLDILDEPHSSGRPSLAEQQEFFQVAHRFRHEVDPEAANHLGEELGRRVFGVPRN